MNILSANMKKCRRSCTIETEWNRIEEKAFQPYVEKIKTQDLLDEITIHEYFYHNIVSKCPRCIMVLPYDLMEFHKKARCNDYLGADMYQEQLARVEKKRK